MKPRRARGHSDRCHVRLALLGLLAGGCDQPGGETLDAWSAGLGVYEGAYEGLVHDDIDGSATEYRMLRLDEQTALELDFEESDEAARSLVERLWSGDALRVHGQLVDGRLVVSRLERARSSDELGTLRQAIIGPGDRTAAVILVGFQGSPSTYDPNAARNVIFGTSGRTTNTFYREASRGRVRLNGIQDPDGGDVFGPYTVPFTSCNDAGGYGQVGQAARQLADADGANTSAYDHIIHLLPGTGCPGGGVATMPGRFTWLFGLPINSVWDFTAHEVGHNFGLPHSAWYENCTSRSGSVVTRAGACNHHEYGDPTDIMGRRDFQFSSFFLERLLWLDADNGLVLDGSRRVVLSPIEGGRWGIQSLRVPRPQGTGGEAFYHFEYRQPFGEFDSRLDSTLMNGVLVRLSGAPTHNGAPRLLDMTPGSRSGNNDTLDATLTAGSSFHDGNLQVTVVEVTPDCATLDITLNGAAPDPNDPVGTCDDGDDTDASTVYLEAECATTAMGNYTDVYATSPGYSGMGHITSAAHGTSATFSESDSPDRATYTVSNIEAGRYKLWFRVNTNGSADDDSWFYRINDGSWSFNNDHYDTSEWQWIEGAAGTITLTTGTHTIEIANRESGLHIDKIALLPATEPAPSGTGSTADNCDDDTGGGTGGGTGGDGTGAGGIGTGGGSGIGEGGSGPDGGGGTQSGTGGDTNPQDIGGGPNATSSDELAPGCSCRTAPGRGPFSTGLLGVLVLPMLLCWRRFLAERSASEGRG